MFDKPAIRDAVIATLEAELATLSAAAHSARDEATNEENRQEGKFDMRAQSAAYLAAGQAKLASELAAAIGAYRTLAVASLPPGSAASVGALVTVETGGKKSLFLLGPARGGLEIDWKGTPVTIVTSGSPLGGQLIGRKSGQAAGPRHTVRSVE